MPARHSSRLSGVLPGALFILGSVLFVSGGRHHPHIDASIGEVGSEAFYRAFAAAIVHVRDWQSIHMLILAGPVLWALGAAGLARGAPALQSPMQRVGRTAFSLGAVAWIVTFVFDGFAAPVIAGALAAEPAGTASSTLMAFRANQVMVITLGLLGWTMIGIGTLAISIGLLRSTRLASARVLGAIGAVIGAWPMIAWATGEFVPGPFTSSLWTPTALVTALWYASLGVMSVFVGSHAESPIATPSTESIGARSVDVSPA